MKKLTISTLALVALFLVLSISLIAQKPIDHSVYNEWKELKNQKISNDGKFVAYELVPFKGDGQLCVYNTTSGETDTVWRGYKPKFSFNSEMLIYRIQPQFDTVRAATLKKVKKEKLPKDSLGIRILAEDRVFKFSKIKNYQLPESNSNWIAILLEAQNIQSDTVAADSLKPQKKSKKKEVDNLLILNPINGDSILITSVKHYSFSKNGTACATVQVKKDSIDSVTVAIYHTENQKLDTLISREGVSENIALSEDGKQLAFTFSSDTGSVKAYDLFYFDLKEKDRLHTVNYDVPNGAPKDWSVSKNGKLSFNETGTELYFGVAPNPEPETKDTLTEDEKVSVDIWNWKDPYLQPHQLKQLEKEKKRTHKAVYFPKKDAIYQLGSPDLESVSIDLKATGLLSLAYDNTPYRQQLSWEASRYRDVYLVNRSTGHRAKILDKVASAVSLSPNQKYVAWYAITDSSWYAYEIKTQKKVLLTDKCNINFYNEENDVPNEAGPHGMAGWTREGDLVVYDRYDLWRLDPSGKKPAENLTKGEGRNKDIRFRYVKLDKDLRSLPKAMLLSAFHERNKKSGFYTLKTGSGVLQQLLLDDYMFSKPIKAKEADLLIWTKQSFQEYPDLYLSHLDFTAEKPVSDANPQQRDFLWGSVKLVSWNNFDGDSLSGLLYKPANFDPDKKYPMLVYFYERYSDRLHKYHLPKPIRSVINFSYYTSNGYLIFVPDIIYKTGYPGPSAFNCIVSGTQALLNKYSFIDRNKLGIQGQSWGGYQAAYVITQTNMFRAAMAGAPVSNMTSAYGGIRWGSGLSRAFQYEETQSRIGGTLWEKRDLYILNSPLFFADQVQTPLLMMHNDKDGAVPWYQGIEFFNALRRLQQPVWMLVYNGAPHNLKRKADMVDLTIRMQQFFDFYLKDAAEPVWMKEGVPALQKGKAFGFETD